MSTQPNERIPEWTVGDRLRKARVMLGMTTRDFAELIGVSQATVTNAENGHHAVRPITINAWSLATGVPVAWLKTGESVAPPPTPGTHQPRKRHLTPPEIAAKKRRHPDEIGLTDRLLGSAA